MSLLLTEPNATLTTLWEHFEAKAVALGATVIHAAAESGLSAGDGNYLCRAELAVAETGSLLVSLPRDERARALLAERLYLIVQRRDIVATLDDALQRVCSAILDAGNRYATFMSGPSRTADIERTLTIGVHGPRELVVVVIGEPSG